MLLLNFFFHTHFFGLTNFNTSYVVIKLSSDILMSLPMIISIHHMLLLNVYETWFYSIICIISIHHMLLLNSLVQTV